MDYKGPEHFGRAIIIVAAFLIFGFIFCWLNWDGVKEMIRTRFSRRQAPVANFEPGVVIDTNVLSDYVNVT